MKKYINYNTILNDIEKLAFKINNSKIKYDAILAISGGGLFPARLLRNYLNIPIYSINIKFYNENNKKTNEPKILQWLGPNEKKQLENKNILVVDDLDDTRGTILKVLYLLKLDKDILFKNLGFCVLYNKLKDKAGEIPFFCEYIYLKDIQDDWIVFPWEFEKKQMMTNYSKNKIL